MMKTNWYGNHLIAGLPRLRRFRNDGRYCGGTVFSLKVAGFCLLILGAHLLKAQETVYALNQFIPLRYNPAYSVLDYQAGLQFFHEEYTIGTGDFISTNAVNVDYPFIQQATGKKLLGMGLSALVSDAGESDLLKTYDLGLSLATPIQLANRHWASMGAGVNYRNKRTSLEHLTTGSQWIASEFRYDPNAALGEVLSTQNISYLSVSAGVNWMFQTELLRQTLVSVAAYDLNRPSESFFDGDERLPMNWVAFAETILYQNHRVMITPSFYYSHRGTMNHYKAFVSTKLLFENNNPYDVIKSGNIDVQLSYGMRGDAAASIMLNQPGFSAGFSYNFPVSNSDEYLQHIVQVGVSLTKTLWKPSPKTIVIEAIPATRSFDFERRSEQVTVERSELDLIREELDQLDNVKALQFELQKDFKFALNSAQMDEGSHAFLDDLVELMNENQDFSLQVIGHTDNIGRKSENYALSVERAETVADYLIGHGVQEGQVVAIGRGDTEPVVDNDTEEGKAKNRRVEFIIKVQK